MLSVDEAFRKFKSRLELNDKEQKNASARQTEVRDHLVTKFDIDRSFLTGSYARHTKTKPLKDIDIFFVLKESEKDYRSKAASVVIGDFYDALAEKYGKGAVRKQSRSVNVDFGVVIDAEDNTDYRIVSVDVVPAFADGDDYYEIPDDDTGKWIKTNPEIHARKATDAHQAYSNEWKGLVRMAKYWNNNARHGEKPVKPSFLIEVMALRPKAARPRSADGREPGCDDRHRPCSPWTQWRSPESMARAVRPEISAFVTRRGEPR